MQEHKENRAQTLAIQHASGPMQVLAGPGSGKTYLIIRRICHLIRYHGVSPGNILVITFTKAAAQEMEERFYRLTQGGYPSVCFGTFHAIYFRILKQSGCCGLTIATLKERQNYLRHILQEEEAEEEDTETVNRLLKAVSIAKNNGEMGAGRAVTEKFDRIFSEYGRLMEEENKVDFDDMIQLCDKLLTEREDICAYWQNEFTHILVDEFQDISPLQYQVLCRLALPQENLFVVGDDDQSVYGFRGAGPDIMKKFMEDYPKASQVIMDINYRCAQTITDAALKVIKENKNRFDKRITSDKKGGDAVKITVFETIEEENDYLIRMLMEKKEEELIETAVIYRTNAQAAAFSGKLTAHKIPFSINEKTQSLFHTPEAFDILACMTFANDCFKSPALCGSRSDFFRFMNKPPRYIKRTAVEEKVTQESLLAYYEGVPGMKEKIRRLFKELAYISGLRPYLSIDYIRKSMRYDSYLSEGKRKEEYEKSRSILEELQQSAKAFRTLAEWKHYIEEQEGCSEKYKAPKGVSLLTMHGSKGLEFKNVYLAGICEGKVPNKKAVLSHQTEEERRLFYVGMTRAVQHLEITCHGKPSVFLDILLKNSCSVSQKGRPD